MELSIKENNFKKALQANQRQLGAFMALADPVSAELMATTGFDWLLIDGEHGPNDIKSILAQLQALAAYPVSPVVRMQGHDVADIKRVLDVGGQTLLIPMVESADQAKQLVQAVQYPPKGIRGMGGGLTRATRWGSISDYLEKADDNICLILQLESPEGITQLDTITNIDGVDAIFIGPADLAAAMGYIGQPAHPEVCKVVEDAIKRIHALGKPVGVYCGDPEQVKKYQSMGASFFLIGADTMLLKLAASKLVDQF
ncbi:MAG: 2-keto-3-deoxy-L-rhamnonate aldolase [Piscirickettsiaceae bacterium]|nr:MAG: 2-keto-3-deoxy-L-rhamnonate aldolase [Piscirickettsiaceae bacterium]